MVASKKDIRRWFDAKKAEGHTHMIVMCDTFDHEDYPVGFTGTAGEVQAEVERRREEARRTDMGDRVMECYNLSMDREVQMQEYRAFNY